MRKIIALKQSELELEKKQERIASKEDLINFVGSQFRQLKRKHLRLPMQLYHL